MKYIIITVLLTTLYVKGMCQNNAIFNGGMGDGWDKGVYLQASNNIFNGGDADGWALSIYQQPESNIFNGGIGDGWAKDTASLTLTVGIIENTFGSTMVAYPNPTSNQLNIDLGNIYHAVIIEIYNSTGQLISVKQYEQVNFINADIEGVKGIYFVKLKNDKNTATIKVVKN